VITYTRYIEFDGIWFMYHISLHMYNKMDSRKNYFTAFLGLRVDVNGRELEVGVCERGRVIVDVGHAV